VLAFASSIPARVTYAAGRCNIGTAEIERRRRFGHIGLAVTLVLLAALLLADAPREWRLVLFFTAAGSAAGYLQARLRFCAAFGWWGVFNFGRLGDVRRVIDPADLRRDRLMAFGIALGSALVGLVVAAVAYLI
jgi:hypothetical protein